MSKPRFTDPVTFNSAPVFGDNPSFVAQQREGVPFNPLGARISNGRIKQDLPDWTPKVRYLAVAPVQIRQHFIRSDRWQGLGGEHGAIVQSLSRRSKYLIPGLWYGSPRRKQRQR
jgi:hypothetical protein